MASPSSRRAWIEICPQGNRIEAAPSPSSRRAWIEILVSRVTHLLLPVALLAEGVDRNDNCVMGYITIFTVALLAEGVDRNLLQS